MEPLSFRAIVPAGGAGTRLWPVSRRSNPKFLHDFVGAGESLLQTTVDRLGAIAEEVLVVTGDVHAAVVQEQVPACGVLTEPSPKDSMAAIALGAAVLRRRYPREDLVVGSFAADHVITNVSGFNDAVATAVALARAGEVVTIGISPTYHSPAYGYIRPGESIAVESVSGEFAKVSDGGAGAYPAAHRTAHRVVEFVEKPPVDVAGQYVAQGYLWNAGMYVVRAEVLLGALADLHPELAAGIEEIAAAWDTDQRRGTLARVWPTLQAISIDHAIAEPLAPTGRVAVVPADLGWSDVGDWDAIGNIRAEVGPGCGGRDGAGDGAGDGARDGAGDALVLGERGKVTILDSPGAVVAPRKNVVVVGIEGAIVIETGDAILVTTREHAQRVKEAVEILGQDHPELL